MPVQNQNLNQVFQPALAVPLIGPTPPPTGDFILVENSGFILQEQSGDRILLE